MIQPPLSNEYASFYGAYVKLASTMDGMQGLTTGGEAFLQTLRGMPESKAQYAYAPGKWTVNELVQHIIDAEIIFNFRALSIARGETQPLPGFEQDDYVASSNVAYKPLSEIVDFFETTRKQTIALFSSFAESVHEQKSICSGAEVSVRAIAFIINGHCMHHHAILKERYV